MVNEQNEDIDAGISSCKMSALQSMFTQDRSSHETIVKNEELTPETSTTDMDDIVTTLATQNSEKEWSVKDFFCGLICLYFRARSTDTLDHMRGRGVLLETPTGFAVFTVNEPLGTETAWMHFMDIATAKMVVSLIGFIKLDVKSAAWGEGDGGTSKFLEDLIRKSLKDKTELLVDTKFKDVVEGKFGITCCDDDGIAGDLIWGLKKILREFMPDEEKHNITEEYYFPLSKGWNEFLLKYSISVPATVRNSYLMSKIFLLRSLDLTLDRVPRNLRESFDKRVNGIGNHIRDNFIQIILGALDQLGVLPGQIESVVAFIKLRLKEIEVATRHDEEEKISKDGHGKRMLQNEKRSFWHSIVGLLVLGGIVMELVTAH